MTATISVSDLLHILLYIAGAAALIYLALVLKNVFQITGKIKNVLEENEVAINDTIKRVPSITNNVDKISADTAVITGEANQLVTTVKPEVERLSKTLSRVSDTVDDVSNRVDTTSLKVQTTLADVSDSISDTAKTISINANNVIDYFYILREVIDALRDVFFK